MGRYMSIQGVAQHDIGVQGPAPSSWSGYEAQSKPLLEAPRTHWPTPALRSRTELVLSVSGSTQDTSSRRPPPAGSTAQRRQS